MGMTVYCEQCGEDCAIYHGGHAALCDDCLCNGIREVIRESGLGHKCCRLLTRMNGQHAICFEQYGTEHDHDSTASEVSS